jgi:hypothetical protein
MKKISLQIALMSLPFFGQAQFNVSDFETFTLSPNSFYKDTNSTPFLTGSASFQHKWDTAFSFWSGGFSYTNKYDSATAGFGNLFGVQPYKGYNNSNIYVVGQDRGVISLASAQNTLDGFYITNTTYAYKSMKNGDQFAKKFGGLTGNDPDYFKITVKGFDNGVMKQDSVEFYLADFRFANNTLDYIVNTWQWFNTSALGEVDSVKFFMYSSDMGAFGINTPLFFGMDNFTTRGAIVGLAENEAQAEFQVYPNPFQSVLYLQFKSATTLAKLKVYDALGHLVFELETNGPEMNLDLSALQTGLYLLELNQNGSISTKRVIKN